MVVDEQDPGVLWLLRGCPRRWFEKGRSVVVEDAPTYYGTMELCTASDGNTLTIDVDAPCRPTPHAGSTAAELRGVCRDPLRRMPTKVTVNGLEAKADNDVVSIPSPEGHIQVVCSYR